MNTEGEVVGKDNKVLDATAIAAKIEFALGKDDITDMLVEEHIESIVARIKEAEQEREKHRLEYVELEKDYNDYLISMFKREFAKEIRAAKKYVGDIQISVNASSKTYLTHPKVFLLVSHATEDYNGVLRRSKRPHEHSRSVDGLCVSRGVSAWAAKHVDPNDTASKGTNRNTSYMAEHLSWRLDRNYSDDELNNVFIFKKLVKVSENWQSAQEKAAILDNELTNIETSTKRAKAKLVRSLLNASEQGRQLLAKMPNFGNKLLLVDGNG